MCARCLDPAHCRRRCGTSAECGMESCDKRAVGASGVAMKPVAILGGSLNRRHDAPPGDQTMCQGCWRLATAALVCERLLETLGLGPASEECVQALRGSWLKGRGLCLAVDSAWTVINTKPPPVVICVRRAVMRCRTWRTLPRRKCHDNGHRDACARAHCAPELTGGAG